MSHLWPASDYHQLYEYSCTLHLLLEKLALSLAKKGVIFVFVI